MGQIYLRELKLHDCIGCYGCWLKTPGICGLHDDMEFCLKEYLDSDVAILASPVIMGFVSSLLKCFHDRLLPLGHPFLILKDNKMAHVPRYEHYPQNFILLDEKGSDNEVSRQLILDVYSRSSRGLGGLFTTKNSTKEILNGIAHH